MAERVEIRGGDLDGSILSNAATEATLLRLVNLMEKSTGSKSSSGGGAGGGASNKLQDMYNKSLGSTNRELGSTAKSSSKLGNSFSAASKAISETTGVIGNILGKSFGLAVSGAAFAVNGLKDYLLASYETFRKTSDVGASFGGDMTKLSQIATKNGMSMEHFGKLIVSNSNALTALGGTATNGAKRLGELRDEIFKPGGVSESLNGLGLATEDIEEAMGSYLETQTRLGNLENRSNKELAASTAMYVEELDKVSKLTGASRKDLQDKARKQALDPVINAMRASIEEGSPQMAKAMANMTAVQEMGGQKLEDAMKEIATGVITSPLAKNLKSFGGVTEEIAKGLIMGERDAATEMGVAAENMQKHNMFLKGTNIMGNVQVREGAEFLQGMRRYNKNAVAAAEQEAKERKSLTTAVARFPEMFNQTMKKIQGAFLNSRFFNAVINYLNSMADKLLGFLNTVNFESITENFGGTLEQIFGGLSGVITPIFDKISNLFSSTMKSIDFDKIKDMVSNLFNKITNFFNTSLNSIDFNKISEVMQKVFGAAIITFNDILEKYVFPMIEKATGIMQKIAPKISPIIEDFGDIMIGVFEFITDTVMPILAPIGNLILDSINPVIDIIGGIMKVLKGVFTGNFSVAMDGMSEIFKGISDQAKVLGSWFKETWNAFGGAFRKMGDFFSSIPLYIEKYISEMSVLGSLAQKAGLVRSTEEINKDLEKKRKEDEAKTAIASPLEVRTKQQLEDQKEKNRVEEEKAKKQSEIKSGNDVATKPLTSGMQPPATERPGATGTQKLTQEEAKKNAATTGSQTSTTPTATTTQQKLEADTMIETLKKIDGVLISMATNSPTHEQTKQLNTLLEQLLAVNKQQLEANQDLVKATKGSYNPI